MLQIRRKQNNSESSKSSIWRNECELLVNRIYIGEAEVVGSPPCLELDIKNSEVGRQISSCRFSQIFKDVESLILHYRQDWTQLDSTVFVSRNSNEQNFIITFVVLLDAANWKQLWSINEYIQEFNQIINSFNSSEVFWKIDKQSNSDTQPLVSN